MTGGALVACGPAVLSPQGWVAANAVSAGSAAKVTAMTHRCHRAVAAIARCFGVAGGATFAVHLGGEPVTAQTPSFGVVARLGGSVTVVTRRFRVAK